MTSLKTLAATGLLLTALAGSAYADSNYAVVHDAASGTPVHNTYGNCVRTKWLNDRDTCPGAASLTQEERTVYFDFNKSTLTPEARRRLTALVKKIKASGPVLNLEVVGFADRIGTPTYNEKLSKKRAETVHSFLVAHGLVHSNVGQTRWLGDTEPKTDCPASLPRKKLIACLKPDRRVEVEIVYDP